jgi:uncharacterized protein YgiM (DUF1202 family)
MKIKYSLIFATLITTSVLAQTPSSTAPAPAPVAPAPVMEPAPSPAPTEQPPAPPAAKKIKKKKVVKKVEPKTPPAPPFAAGETAVSKQKNVNIRAQANINSEVIGKLQKGDTVTVLEEVTLKHPKTDEPAKWLRIALPASIHAWVDSKYIDATNQVVTAKKLNVRGGAGENYSIIGRLEKGDTVKPLDTKGDWTQIEAPAKAAAFVAAHLLAHQENAAAIAANNPPSSPTPPAVTPTPTMVESAPPVTPASTENPAPTPAVAPAPVPAPAPVEPAPAPAPASEEKVPRIVTREGVVGNSVSIQAPTMYRLLSTENGEVMDFLSSPSNTIAFARYRGLTVLVQGEEELDERWPNTPVLTIQRIQIVK